MTFIISLVALLCALGCIIAPVHSESCECQGGWMHFKSSCYVFGHHDLDFQEAERFCVHYGAHLVKIETSVENNFLKSYLSDFKDPKHWIGLTDEIVEGAWKWYSDNSDATFTGWSPGQPNDGKTSNCAAIWASYSYRWVDEPCTHLFKPLCEKSSQTEIVAVGK